MTYCQYLDCYSICLHSFFMSLEPVQDLDYGMQDKAKGGEKAQHTGVFEHFELTFNVVMCPLARS